MNCNKITIVLKFIALFAIPPIAISQYSRILIIAPNEFIDELQPLKQFKDCSMRPVTLISLTDIYNNSSYNGLRDNPEKVKKCIAHYKKIMALIMCCLLEIVISSRFDIAGQSILNGVPSIILLIFITQTFIKAMEPVSTIGTAAVPMVGLVKLISMVSEKKILIS